MIRFGRPDSRNSSRSEKPAKVTVVFEKRGFTVIALVDGAPVGDLQIETRGTRFMDEYCSSGLRQLADKVGAQRDKAMVVRYAEIREAFRGRGIGLRLYRLAARVAARRYNQLLSADNVLPTGATSDNAKSVWRKLTTLFPSQNCGPIKNQGIFVWGGR